MMRSEARVATADGARYADLFCKHAAHMTPKVEWSAPSGSIEFPDAMGFCRLEVQPDLLILRIESADPANLAKMQKIIGADIERLAFREGVKVEWGPPD
jgi:uncharacterized protein